MRKKYFIPAFLGLLLILGGLLIVVFNIEELEQHYLITYKNEYDKIIFKQYVRKGQIAKSKTPNERADEVFVGWYLNDEEFDFSKPITSDIVLVGRWEDKFIKGTTYKITFYLDKDVYEIQEVLKETFAERPTEPKVEGYQFVGWYQDDIMYDFNLRVTKNIKLIAKFRKIQEQEQPNVPNEDEELTTKPIIPSPTPDIIPEEPDLPPTSSPTPPPVTPNEPQVQPTTPPETPTEQPEEKPPLFIKETGISTNLNNIIIRRGESFKIEASIEPSNATIQDLYIYCEDSLVCYVDSERKIQTIREGTTNLVIKTFHGIQKNIQVTVKPGYRTIENQDGRYFIIATNFDTVSGRVTLRYEGETTNKTVYISKQGIPATKKIKEIIKVVLDD